MAKKMRYGANMNVQRRSGTRRAIRQKQLLATLASLLLCALVGFGVWRLTKAEEPKPSEETPEPTGGVTVIDGTQSLAGPHGLYTEGFLQGLSEDDLWMEDFEDTRTRTNVKAMYLTADVINKKMDTILDLLDTTELNAVVIDIKNDDGFIVVDTDSEYLDNLGNKNLLFDNFDEIVQKFKEHNVYLIARVVCFRDLRSVKANESFGVRMKDGSLMKDSSGYTWMNPLNEETWEYLTEVGRQAAKLGFDEVNFDYCRFSTDGKMKDADFGVELTTEVKMNAITGFVKYACENLKPLGVFVSVDVFGVVISSEIDAAAVGQSYSDMAKYLDYICPMVYPSHYGKGYYNLDVPDAHPYELIYNSMLDSKKKLSANVASGRCADVRPWLQAFTATWVSGHIAYGGPQIRDQINGTYDAGYSGWLLWNAAGNYSKDGLLQE